MDRRMRFWDVALIVMVCMSVTVTKSNGARPLNNQLQEGTGVKWAFLVAGSRGYGNYRHQADVCHAYQVLKSGGLKDENIIVMMYDDIADSIENPIPGAIINQPDGPDVFQGVPLDYTGLDANINNFYAVLRGYKSGLIGGSGKVLNSKPEDTVFIYIASHGNKGIIGLPDDNLIYADQFLERLKINYKKMVIYIESCNAGSMFEGLLRDDLNIYATTSSNSDENSHAFYCPGGIMPPPPTYTVCLGDLYSISWLEFSDFYDRANKTLHDQYDVTWFRTLFTGEEYMSHVMPYGNMTMNEDLLETYLGRAKPARANDNYHFNRTTTHEHSNKRFNTTTRLVSQQDAHLLYLNLKVIYIESCNAGSMFEGLLRDDLNIYATTSSNSDENSHAFYCPGGIMPPPPYYNVCLGDLYSISWLEFSDFYDRANKTLHDQYDVTWFRTLFTGEEYMSHVMPYGNMTMNEDLLETYLGRAKPARANDNYHFNRTTTHEHSNKRFNTTTRLVSQQDAHLLYLNLKLEKAPDDSMDKSKAQIELDDEISHRKHDDQSVYLIWKLLFGEDTPSTMMANLRSVGQPLVDDWDCLRMLKNTYEHHCGVLSHYGLKYMQAFANMCNDGISKKQMIAAASQACHVKNDVP
ncbi:vacuolar-processing enzyme gamma-isozyme-like [Cicer arietinum]|uniref:vacuolar-processing enzyme gamma-isozyme-like n=1 Tax=Cicer arietinum TaxID=3827 RepID=UPI003CC61807